MTEYAGRTFRLRRRSDISRVFEDGRRRADGRLTLFAVRNGLGYSRMGLGVSVRHGTAVRRNRIKRVCREAFRTIREELPAGLDYMIVPRVGPECGVEGVQASLKSLAVRLAAELGREGGGS